MADERPFPLPLPWSWRRISLRRLEVDDLAAFQAYRRDPEVARYQGWKIVDDDAARSFLEKMRTAPMFLRDKWFQLGIALRETQELIGDVGVCVDSERSSAEIGFTVNPRFQGQGLASEAVQEITSRTMQFGAVDKVVARPDARNERSIRLLERIGFESEGEATFHDEDGEQREIIYARTRPRQKKPSRRR